MISAPTVIEDLTRGRADGSIALLDGDRTVTYAELRERLRERAAELALPARSPVVLAGARTIDHVLTYLALLDAGHVPIPVGDRAEELADAWGATAVIRTTPDGYAVDRRDAAPPELHPELALLLSTSGSTGNPKLVRLSYRNLVENARSIADYLHLDEHDRGITTLPLHYCYGLSVLHSHLAAGAGIVVSDASVVDPCFRDAIERYAVTNVAGVPHTFDLLERAGPEILDVPSLRFLTQAGGRLAPDAVRRWIRRTDAWDAEYFVMYGQTEATARMAYLPPEIARRRPESIGVAIPGGELEVRALGDAADPGDGVGELVYRGPNVMLGYAERIGDLAAGRELTELCTGDLARFHADDGVFEIVGRMSRFVKPFGVRVDLGDVEEHLAGLDEADEIAVAGDDTRLVVAAPGADPTAVRVAVAARTGLPPHVIVVETELALPRTDAGKPDHPEILRRAAPVTYPNEHPAGSAGRVLADVLGRDHVRPSDTFVGLGGDSLSYVECSVRLERQLGPLPAGWHLRTVDELDAHATAAATGRRRTSRVDTTVALRAIAICAVVATHMRLWHWPGGAHLLLVVVGFNFARFVLPVSRSVDRVRAGLRTVGRVAVPTVLWTAAGLAFTGAAYGTGTLLLVNNYVGPMSHDGDHWHFWFIEVFVHVMVIATALAAIPAVHRADRRFSFAVPLAVLALTLVVRLDWSWLPDWQNYRFRTHSIAWFMALGWLIHRSDTVTRRVVASGLCLWLIPDYFQTATRGWFIAIALLVLVWAREVPVWRPAVRPIALVASASMWILISHFTIWPPLVERLPLGVAYVLTIAAGIGIRAVADRVTAAMRRWPGPVLPALGRVRSSRTPALTP